MRETTYHFKGRGVGSGNQFEPYRLIECADGTVMAIISTCHGVQFVVGYCRQALFDRWGLYCGGVFTRESNATLTRSWAMTLRSGLFFFTPMRLELVEEQDWMRKRE
jgi:hypothetical protein